MLKRRVNHNSPTTSKDLRYSGLLLQLDSVPYCRCPPPGSGIAAATRTADLTAAATAAASTIDAENMVHSDSMSPTFLRIWSKLRLTASCSGMLFHPVCV
ncbi:hypothetical protein XENOCAPTIV_010949 [Xenoophorus captivus]|uniref:Uncharacterized protein n=1 Tax=Xenoophorus captivus TaxID=1517983 RepID=A0ABV0QHP4_9TELE